MPFPASPWMTPPQAGGHRGVPPSQGFAYLHFSLIIAIMFTAHSHLRLLIWDLGHFLIVSFKLGLLWIADSPLSNFSPPHYALPSPPLLISWEAGESVGLTHISSCQGPMSCGSLQITSLTWNSRVHLEQKTKLKIHQLFPPSFLPGHICVNVLHVPLLLFNWELLRRQGRMKNSCVSPYIWDLLSTYFSVFPQLLTFQDRFEK